MTTVLGKRKSHASPAGAAAPPGDIFRRFFEANFEPLPVAKPAATPVSAPSAEDEDDEPEDGDEWAGLSDYGAGEPGRTIEIVEHTALKPLPALSRREAKAYLSSRPPTVATASSSATAAAPAQKAKKATPGDEDSADLLRNDLALQRLLSESHLFNPSPLGAGSGVDTTHHGRTRHVATDLRLSSLGSKSSIFKQAKMPMSHRKGIEGAKVAREEKRRREAKENGIVLERPAPGKGPKAKDRGRERGAGKRERAVDAPAVGKFQGSTMLRLSKKDVAEIQGGGGAPRGGKTKRRRR
ncbi:hypothetical protein BJ170DRAFT_626488 [Xylariales sp. AK1849]|nr:hypothetical protein BJ170DRAFT_626488 [Xylariales sp. AK1849]